jgi:NAD(P)-dependent dehydrogenase (short-subunit alcohol dehydrogenase family)
MDKKVAIVTGASSGIGHGLTAELLNRGLHVIAVSRYTEKAKRTFRRLSRRGDIEWLSADLSSLSEVRKLVSLIKMKYKSINILFNIAGCIKVDLEKSVDDLEYMFATNYLSHFLLTNKLIPLLKKSDNSRVITISGEGHRECFPGDIRPEKINYDKLLTIDNFESGLASRQIVLAKILFTYELSSRIQDLNIETCSFCPGSTRTNIMHDFPWPVRAVATIQLLFQGSRSPSDLAVDICKLAFNFKNINGKYYLIRKSGIREEVSSRESYLESLGKKLWNISEYLTEETFDRKYFNSS